jgi:hypothetical protein
LLESCCVCAVTVQTALSFGSDISGKTARWGRQRGLVQALENLGSSSNFVITLLCDLG